jgi:hypothetical protein
LNANRYRRALETASRETSGFPSPGRSQRRSFAAQSIAASDHEKAADLISRLAGSDRELDAWLNLLRIQTEQKVEVFWNEIEAIAAALLEHGTLSAKRCREIVANANRPRP